jgi:hypothetical protein
MEMMAPGQLVCTVGQPRDDFAHAQSRFKKAGLPLDNARRIAKGA